MERENKCILGNLKERDYMEGIDIDGKANIPKDLKDIDLIVAPCIFVESLQFINQRMHI